MQEPKIFLIFDKLSPDSISRKRVCTSEAQQKWPFLTTIDCRSLKTTDQLRALVKVGGGLTNQQARLDVEAWAEGKDFSSGGEQSAGPTAAQA